MESLEKLRDFANGKRRRFYNVSPKASAFFKKFLADYHAAPTLEGLLDRYEMTHVLEDYLFPRLRLEGKRAVVEAVVTRVPWGGNESEPFDFNHEVMYLVAEFVNTKGSEKLRLCPRCGTCYVARGGKKFCTGLCGRRAASARIVGAAYNQMREKRIAACRAAYTKYKALRPKPREPKEEYVLREANRHLPRTYKIGGPKMQTNFITRNATAIGMPKPKGAK